MNDKELVSSPEELEPGARERLLRGATEVFNQKGYAAASVNEIVAAAGVTRPVLYYYFKNKEHIYIEILKSSFAMFGEVLSREHAECSSVTAKLLALFEDVTTLFRQNLPVIRLFHAIYYGPPQGAPFFDFSATHLDFQRRVQEFVEEGIQRGEFLPLNPVDMAFAMMAAVIFCLDFLLCPEVETMPEPDYRRLLAIVFRGILVPAGR